jgi:hypothetical protein
MDAAREELLKELAMVDITHEVRSLARWSKTTLITGDVTRKEPGFVDAANQAFGECAFLHLRNLADFLEHRSTAKTDVIAADYFDRRDAYGPAKALLADDRRGLNRHLAHISSDRVSSRHGPTPFTWARFVTVADEVLHVHFSLFLQVLRGRHPDRALWFAEADLLLIDPWRSLTK